jgi:hypothetical protein
MLNRTHSQSFKKFVGLHLLQNHLDHPALCSISAANEYNIWNDIKIHMDPEQVCVSCKTGIIQTSSCNTHLRIAGTHPGQTIFMDILHPVSNTGLTPYTYFPFYLSLGDAFSCYSPIYGLPNKLTDSVILSIEQFVERDFFLFYIG